MPPSRILIGVPTGWHLYAVWQANFMSKIGEQRTDEIALHFAPSNTKAVAYSELIDQARNNSFDYLLLWETNISIETPLQFVLRRIQQFHCVVSPGRVQAEAYEADPIFAADTSELPSEEIGEGQRELMPFEVRSACTHLVAMDRKTLNHLKPRYKWVKEDTHLERDAAIYCFDGDTWPDHPDPKISGPDSANPVRRLAIEQSLFSNVRAAGIGVWADPQLKTVNHRLGASYRSLRLEDLPPR